VPVSRSRPASRRRRRCTTRRYTSLWRAYLCESRLTSADGSLRSLRAPCGMPKLGDAASGSAREMSPSTKARRVACSRGWTSSALTGSEHLGLHRAVADKVLIHRAMGRHDRAG
jgi:hypothetical protein